MRLAVAASWALAVCACDCGDPVLTLDGDAGPADAGASSDAGHDGGGKPVDDAGARDAGTADGGDEPDAGPLCILDVPATPFTCEGDEDFCDALGDTYNNEFAPPPLPQSDLLAAWSRVEDGVFVLDLRFAAPPFTSLRAQSIGLLLWEDNDPATDDVGFIVQTEAGDVHGFADRLFVLSLGQPFLGTYAPHLRTSPEGGDGTVDLDVCAGVAVSDDGLTVRIRMSGDFPYEPGSRYLPVSRLPPGISIDVPPAGAVAVTSLGGAPDDETFESICTAGCPGD